MADDSYDVGYFDPNPDTDDVIEESTDAIIERNDEAVAELLTKWDEFIVEMENSSIRLQESIIGVQKQLNADAKDLKYTISAYDEARRYGAPDLTGLAKPIVEEISGLMEDSVGAQLSAIKSEYELAEMNLAEMYKIYDSLVLAGATPEELQSVIEGIAEQQEIISDFNEEYLSTFEAWIDYHAGKIERELQVFEEQTGFLEKIADRLSEELKETLDLSGKLGVFSDILENTKNMITVNEDKIAFSESEMDKNFNDERYAPLYDLGFTKDYILANWFDAEGEATAQYSIDMELLGAGDNSELVGYANDLFTSTQIWVKAIQEAEEINDELKDGLKTGLQDIISTAQASYTYRYNQQNAIIAGLQKEHSLMQQIRTTRAGLNNELEASRHLQEWLDEDTRKLLFNEEDYEILNDELTKISRNVSKLYADYRKDINNLSEDEWYKEAEITAQFQRRIDAQMESYEIAEKELEIAKKRTELENIARQRNTRIMVGGQWRYISDPSQLYEMSKTVAQLEADKKNMLLTNAENATVRSMQNLNDATNTAVKALGELSSALSNIDIEDFVGFAEKYLPDINVSGQSLIDNDRSRVVHFSLEENNAIRAENGYSPITQEELNDNYQSMQNRDEERGYQSSLPDTYIPIEESLPTFEIIDGIYVCNMPVLPTSEIPVTHDSVVETNYNFAGDIIIENPVGDVNDIINSLSVKVNAYVDTTGNMR